MEDRLVSVQSLSCFLNLTPQRIQQLTFEGLPKQGRGEYPLVSCIHWYIQYLKACVNADTIKGVAQKEQILKIKADTDLIEFRKLCGELIEYETANQAWMSILNLLKSELLGIPGRVSHELQGASLGEIKAVLETEIREVIGNAVKKIEGLKTNATENESKNVENLGVKTGGV